MRGTKFWAARWKNFKVRGVQNELLTTRTGSSGRRSLFSPRLSSEHAGVSGRKRRSKFRTHGCSPAGGERRCMPTFGLLQINSDRTDPLCVRCVHRWPNARAGSAADLATDGFRRCYRFSCGSTSEVVCRAFVGRRAARDVSTLHCSCPPAYEGSTLECRPRWRVAQEKAGGKHDDICCAARAGSRQARRLEAVEAVNFCISRQGKKYSTGSGWVVPQAPP